MEPLELTPTGQADRIVVTKSSDGWEVSETHDARLVRTQHFSDWHRVERAVQIFESNRASDHPTNR